jgi:hypothetical protein
MLQRCPKCITYIARLLSHCSLALDRVVSYRYGAGGENINENDMTIRCTGLVWGVCL